jgi:pentapeptide MXKDX repeat protein
MKKVFNGLTLACVFATSLAVFAQKDDMKNDDMKKDDTKKDDMKKDEMKNN